MKKKIGSFTIKITAKYLILRTDNHIVFGMRWINSWRLIALAICKGGGYAMGPALLNFGLSFGPLFWMDAVGVDLRLEILGKGFTYRKFRYCERPEMIPQEQFEIIK